MRVITALLACVVLLPAAASGGSSKDLAALKLFKARSVKGMWKMEVLESSDPRMQEHAKAMGGTAVCVDLAGDAMKVDEQMVDCKTEIVTDAAKAAEVKMTCADGIPTRFKIAKESDTSYLFEWWRTPKDGKEIRMKMRHTYAGECKEGGPKMVMDKNSEACKMMKAQLGDNPLAVCAGVPAAQRGTCEAQIKQTLAMCQ